MDITLVIVVLSVLLISVLFSMFGQGGGSLYTPLLFFLGYTALISISTSLILNLITALSATMVYYRNQLVDLRLSLTFVPGICIGALVGGAATGYVDSTLLMWLFVIFLLGAGGRMVYTYWEKKESESCPLRLTGRLTITIVVFSIAVGILSGLLGVGGGILIVPFLIFLCKHPTKNSAGTAAFVVIFSSIFGIIGHSVVGGELDSLLILATGIAVFVGGLVGAKFMLRSRSEMIKVGFGLIMWLFALQLVLKLTGMI